MSDKELYDRAVKTALNILDYADNTEKRLREKLGRKGYSPDAVEYAVTYVKNKGFLDDKKYIQRETERIANVKLYGKLRIAEELYSKGFNIEDIKSLTYEDIDFPQNCAKRILKTRDKYSDSDKLTASLRRYGFTWNDIREAYEIIKEENE